MKGREGSRDRRAENEDKELQCSAIIINVAISASTKIPVGRNLLGLV